MSGKVGIIGGSGLEKHCVVDAVRERVVDTCWGAPSAPLCAGTLAGTPIVQIARHGTGHTITPTHVNYRANVQALKDAGCTCILATTAVGSLRQEIERGDLVILDQFIDFTKQRKMTCFESFAVGQLMHTPMADPFDARLRELLVAEAARLGLPCHQSGTVVTIEGPRFSTRAESRMFRAWGADVINMSVATEATIANELGMPYAAIAMSTDYDSWNDAVEPVSWEEILNVFAANVENVTRLLAAAAPHAGKAYPA